MQMPLDLASTPNAGDIAQQLFELLLNQGSAGYIGEEISQAEHGFQAAKAAEQTNHDAEVIIAALFHDIGHFFPGSENLENMDGFGIKDHDLLGADYLRNLGFPERVCKLVASHVNAKRYLCFKNPSYLNRLSQASLQTLTFQGGPMDKNEAATFEQDELFPLYIKLRAWDEQAKVVGVSMDRLDRYKELCVEVLSKK